MHSRRWTCLACLLVFLFACLFFICSFVCLFGFVCSSPLAPARQVGTRARVFLVALADDYAACSRLGYHLLAQVRAGGSTLEYPGVPWSTLEYPGEPWSTLADDYAACSRLGYHLLVRAGGSTPVGVPWTTLREGGRCTGQSRAPLARAGRAHVRRTLAGATDSGL